MPTWLKLALTALAAFGLGFAAAHRLPPTQPPAAADLTWVRVGGSVQLTTKAPDRYLIVETAPSKTASPPQDSKLASSSPSMSIKTGETITVQPPMLTYQCTPVLGCSEKGCDIPTKACRKGTCWPPPSEGPYGVVMW